MVRASTGNSQIPSQTLTENQIHLAGVVSKEADVFTEEVWFVSKGITRITVTTPAMRLHLGLSLLKWQ